MTLNLRDPASIAADIEFWRRSAVADFDAGTLVWREYQGPSTEPRLVNSWNAQFRGRQIGARCSASGYWQLVVTVHGKRRKFWRHRVLFAMAHGYWPEEIDHIDRDKSNDSLANLRECTKSQNGCNKTKKPGCVSQFKGVSFCRKTRKWVAQINLKRRHINLGRFDSEIAASDAYKRAAKRLHGEFACA